MNCFHFSTSIKLYAHTCIFKSSHPVHTLLLYMKTPKQRCISSLPGRHYAIHCPQTELAGAKFVAAGVRNLMSDWKPSSDTNSAIVGQRFNISLPCFLFCKMGTRSLGLCCVTNIAHANAGSDVTHIATTFYPIPNHSMISGSGTQITWI